MNKRELDRLSVLLNKFQKEYTLKEIGAFENANVMDTLKLVKRVKKKVKKRTVKR